MKCAGGETPGSVTVLHAKDFEHSHQQNMQRLFGWARILTRSKPVSPSSMIALWSWEGLTTPVLVVSILMRKVGRVQEESDV